MLIKSKTREPAPYVPLLAPSRSAPAFKLHPATRRLPRSTAGLPPLSALAEAPKPPPKPAPPAFRSTLLALESELAAALGDATPLPSSDRCAACFSVLAARGRTWCTPTPGTFHAVHC